jgi:ADP-ribose pyrophosphatase
MQHEERTINKNYIYKGKIIRLRKDDVALPNGQNAVREIVEHGGGACVLYINEGKVLFVRQFRYAYGEEVLEIPAGKLNLGEDPKTTAIRELEEETGIRTTEIKHLFTVYPTPGYTNEKIYIYEAFGGERVKTHLDEDEFLEVEWIPLDCVKQMLKRGEIKDAKTIIALQHYFLNI